MMNFLEDVHFLEYFLSWETIFHVFFVKWLDSDIFSCKFVNCKTDFSKSSFSNFFDQFIIISGRFRNCSKSSYVSSDSLNHSIFVLKGERSIDWTLGWSSKGHIICGRLLRRLPFWTFFERASLIRLSLYLFNTLDWSLWLRPSMQ